MVDLIMYHDCNTSRGLISHGLFTRWKFKFVFDLQLRDLQLHMIQISYFGESIVIPQSSLKQASLSIKLTP